MKHNGDIEHAMRDSSREYAAACDRLAEACRRVRELHALAEDLQSRLKADAGPTTNVAAALSAEDPVELRARLAATREEMRRLRRTVERAKNEVSTARAAALRQLGKRHADAYRNSVRALALAATELGRQLENHRALENGLPGGSPEACGLPRISLRVGDGSFAAPVDALSLTRWGAYLNLAMRIGAIDASELPPAWLGAPARKSA